MKHDQQTLIDLFKGLVAAGALYIAMCALGFYLDKPKSPVSQQTSGNDSTVVAPMSASEFPYE